MGRTGDFRSSRQGFESLWGYCGIAKLERHLAHNQKIRGFDSRSRNEGWQRARTGTDGEALHTIPL
jgi:hypothetical protein